MAMASCEVSGDPDHKERKAREDQNEIREIGVHETDWARLAIPCLSFALFAPFVVLTEQPDLNHKVR
jgi:hypothetical protein